MNGNSRSRYEQVIGNTGSRAPLRRQNLAIVGSLIVGAIIVAVVTIWTGAKGILPAIVVGVAGVTLLVAYLVLWQDAMVRINRWILRRAWSEQKRVGAFFGAFLGIFALSFAALMTFLAVFGKP
jgi:hypothetical protein